MPATRFASTEDFEKGGVEVIGDDQPKRYLFSNMYEVAASAQPWERVMVAKNLEFTVECVRAEGDSPWYCASHDETALSMQGDIEVRFIKPDDGVAPPEETDGAVRLDAEPAGQSMGWVKLKRGHMSLLPAGAAYQFRADAVGVILVQSIQGAETVERWADICQA